VRHPGFDLFELGDNDIGVVILAEPVEDRPSAVIDRAPGDSPIGEIATLVGYGVNDVDPANQFAIKFKAEGQVITDCDALGLAGADFDNGKVICFDQSEGTGACSGDSGGPTFVERDGQTILVGVTSFGDQDCRIFGANTRVDAELDFIDEILSRELPVSCAADGVCQPQCGGPRPADPDCAAPGGDEEPGGEPLGCAASGGVAPSPLPLLVALLILLALARAARAARR
jgi:hypothetical protein